jgi:hypothetical protein
MNSRFTIFLALAALLLFAALFFGPGGLSRKTDQRVGDFVLSFQAEDIRSMEVDRDGGKIKFTRVPDGWTIGPQPADRANSAVVERILSAAQTLLILDAISPAEFRDKYRGQDFGFANPRQRLRFETRAGQLDIFFGREGAGENQVFVRSEPDSTTFLVPDELQKLLLEPADAFRDPRLIPLPPDRIEKLLVERPDGVIELQREGTQWRLTRPLQDWADTATIDQLLEFILGARVFSFLPMENAPADINWNSTVQIWAEGDDAPLILRVADIPGESQIFLEHPGRSAVVRVPSENFHLLRTPLETLRSRQLLHFNPDLVDRFSIRADQSVAEFERAADGGWNERDGTSERSVSADHVDALFELFGTAAVDAFIIGNGGITESAPVAEIALNSWLSENTPEAPAGLHPLSKLVFWEAKENGNPAFLAARINEEPGLRKLPLTFLDDLRLWLKNRTD